MRPGETGRDRRIGGGRGAAEWVGSESERVSKNGQGGTYSCEAVTESIAVGDGGFISDCARSSTLFDRSSSRETRRKKKTPSPFSTAGKCSEDRETGRKREAHRGIADLSARRERNRERGEKEREERVPCYERADAMQAGDSRRHEV